MDPTERYGYNVERLFKEQVMKQVTEELEQAVDELHTTERIALAEAQLYHIWLEEWVQLEKN